MLYTLIKKNTTKNAKNHIRLFLP